MQTDHGRVAALRLRFPLVERDHAIVEINALPSQVDDIIQPHAGRVAPQNSTFPFALGSAEHPLNLLAGERLPACSALLGKPRYSNNRVVLNHPLLERLA